MKITNSGPSLTVETLDAVERQLGSSIPEDFREFYLRNNGGVPQKYLLTVDQDSFIIQEFNQLVDATGASPIISFYMQLVNCDNESFVFPRYLIPFANDPGNNLYCFSIRKMDYGSIWFFDTHQWPEVSPVFLDLSLSLFLAKLS